MSSKLKQDFDSKLESHKAENLNLKSIIGQMTNEMQAIKSKVRREEDF
jgi:hypothetical protein